MSARRAIPPGQDSPLNRHVAILGIDNLSRKNRAQLDHLNALGYAFDVFTSDALGDSEANLPAGNTLTRVAPGAVARTAQVWRYLAANRHRLNHVEVYPGGRFAALYAALAKLHRIPVMVVERGDLLYRDRYDASVRASMALTYRLADVVWCREFYQERALRRGGIPRVFLLANAVAAPVEIAAPDERVVEFAWVNRLIVERKARWVADALAHPDLAEARTVMLGIQPGTTDPATAAQQDDLQARRLPNLELLPYADPQWLYRRARFFLLPSDIVYCNNALLEAMAHGVIPLVSDVEGARLIVDHGVDGFVFPHSPEGLRMAMAAARALSPAEYRRMSLAAAAKMRTRFSAERWAHQLASEYGRLVSNRHATARGHA